MPVIHPSLFIVMKHFPDRKDAVRQMYRTNKSFQGICQNYQKCSEALDYWDKSYRAEAPDGRREYLTLLEELEQEIAKILNEES